MGSVHGDYKRGIHNSVIKQHQYSNWHKGIGIEWTNKSYSTPTQVEAGEGMGDGRAEGSSAIEDEGETAVSLKPYDDGMQVCIFESPQLESSYVGNLLYSPILTTYLCKAGFFFIRFSQISHI